MATYKEIQDWIKQNYNFTVKSCWIGHCKEKYNVPGYKGPSHSRKGEERKHPCPYSKEWAIRTAFEHFNML